MRSTRSWILLLVASLLAALLEVSFFSFLPTPWREIRPVLQVIVLLVVLNSPRGAFVAAGVSGLLIDVFATDSGTFAFGRLIVVAFIATILSETVLTNRSLYATAGLALVARAMDRLLLFLTKEVAGRIFQLDIRLEPLSSFFKTIAWDIGLLAVVFIVLALFTRRFLVTVSRSRERYG
jgi:hypothetical protein